MGTRCAVAELNRRSVFAVAVASRIGYGRRLSLRQTRGEQRERWSRESIPAPEYRGTLTATLCIVGGRVGCPQVFHGSRLGIPPPAHRIHARGTGIIGADRLPIRCTVDCRAGFVPPVTRCRGDETPDQGTDFTRVTLPPVSGADHSAPTMTNGRVEPTPARASTCPNGTREPSSSTRWTPQTADLKSPSISPRASTAAAN